MARMKGIPSWVTQRHVQRTLAKGAFFEYMCYQPHIPSRLRKVSYPVKNFSSRIPRRVSNSPEPFTIMESPSESEEVRETREVKKKRRKSCEEVIGTIADTLEAASAASMVDAALASESADYVDEKADESVNGRRGFDELLFTALSNVDETESPEWLFGEDGTVTAEIQKLVDELNSIGTSVQDLEAAQSAELEVIGSGQCEPTPVVRA